MSQQYSDIGKVVLWNIAHNRTTDRRSLVHVLNIRRKYTYGTKLSICQQKCNLSAVLSCHFLWFSTVYSGKKVHPLFSDMTFSNVDRSLCITTGTTRILLLLSTFRHGSCLQWESCDWLGQCKESDKTGRLAREAMRIQKSNSKGKVAVRVQQFATTASSLWELTCHGSHSHSHPAEVIFMPSPQPKLLLEFSDPGGCQAIS